MNLPTHDFAAPDGACRHCHAHPYAALPYCSTVAASDWDAGYAMGRQHGYEMATAELLRILQDRMKAGEDILPMLPLVDFLRERQSTTLQRRDSD